MVRKVLDLAMPPEVLQLSVGDTCRVKVNFDYAGPRIEGARLYAAIGIKDTWFAEKVYGWKDWTVPETAEETTYTAYADIPITSAITVATGYDMYAKLINLPGADLYSEYLHNVIEIVPLRVVSVKLKNPPPGSEIWAINIRSHDLKADRASGTMRISGMVVWEDLSLYWFPAYVSAVVAKEDLTILWQIISYPDMDWLPSYNPNAVIPGFGDYYLNCSTGLFEKL